MLSVAMLDGKIDSHSSHDFERMKNAKVLELKKHVEIVADPELTKKHPAVRSAIVEIGTFDGRNFSTLVDRLPGAPYNPLSAGEVEDKFLSLSAPVLGAARSRSVVERCRGIENLSDVCELTALLT